MRPLHSATLEEPFWECGYACQTAERMVHASRPSHNVSTLQAIFYVRGTVSARIYEMRKARGGSLKEREGGRDRYGVTDIYAFKWPLADKKCLEPQSHLIPSYPGKILMRFPILSRRELDTFFLVIISCSHS